MKKQNICIIPLKCSQCGIELQAMEGEQVYYCNNCNTALYLKDGELEVLPVEFALPSIEREKEEYVFFPFWSFLVDIEFFAGLKQERFSQFSLAQNKQGVWQYHVTGLWGTDDFGYINRTSNLFMRFCPQYKLSSNFYPMKKCFLSREEAEDLVELIFLSLENETIVSLSKINYKIKILSSKMVGIPFYLDREKDVYRDALGGKTIVPVSLFNK